MDQRRDQDARYKENPLPFKRKRYCNDCNTDGGGLLDARENKRITAGGKQQENRQRIICRISVRKNKVAANRQESPEHQKILCGYTANFQLVIDPVKERVRAYTLVCHFPRAFCDQLISMAIRLRVIALCPQSRKACQQDDDQQGAENQSVPLGMVHRSHRNMIRTPRQCNRYEHEDD